MRYAFQDDEHLLMVLDLKLGGDLRFHLNFKGPFSETRARFYYAEVARALFYLHKQKIVHRDIKPDNILLDEKGHASVTDFNVACHFSEEKPLMSKSGTARYMAPEVILGHGYFNGVDFWSLSITTYELLYGYTPFRSRQREDLKKSITTDPVEFSQNPKHNVSASAIAFLKESLEKPLSERLGATENGGFQKLTKHPWFQDLDWSKVDSKEIPVPFVPDTDKNTFYDPRYGLEEMFSGRAELSDRPVKTNGMVGTRKRASVRSPSGTSSVGAENYSTNRQSIDKSPRMNLAIDRSNALGSTANSPTKDPIKTDKLRKASFIVSKQEPEYISSEEELQLQMFEEKFAVFDWTKPRAANQQIPEINTEEKSTQESCTSHVEIFSDWKALVTCTDLVDITHFELGRCIGAGSFGKVRIVEHKVSKKQYALKYINKNACADKSMAKNVLRERKILEEADSPFICNLRYAFQDDVHVLMVLDLKLGGDLEFHLLGRYFPEDRAKFYLAEITCGLEYMHSCKIIHRDIKPGNILLDENGHACITDFNIVSIDANLTEALQTPFGRKKEEETKFAIINNILKFPEEPTTSEDAKSVLTGLICRDATQRFKNTHIRRHEWFKEYDWVKVNQQDLSPPFKPDLAKIYYDPILELEEIMFESNPLQSKPVKKRKKSQTVSNATKSKAEIQISMLTTGFKDYDFTKVRNESSTNVLQASADPLVK
ncbi:hypothetical protein HDU84_009605 [Entophlyctis sp. JEL0112]|nr:hypothetical protein HDU84_009605 [Entophlyctis sp. JEL0112]